MTIFYSPIFGEAELTAERKDHVLKAHPELRVHLEKLYNVLSDPDEIRRSRFDKMCCYFINSLLALKMENI